MSAAPYDYAFQNSSWTEEKDADPFTARFERIKQAAAASVQGHSLP
jgi:hypothetical protein